ncbi:hypothetical protein ACWIVY_09355, partial [Ursidibacter sp. B-7004-1]
EKNSNTKFDFKKSEKFNGMFSSEVNNSINNPHLKGGEAVMFHVENYGNFEDKRRLEKMFRDKGFNLIFKTSVTYKEIEDLADLGDMYAVAPDWYASTGMFIYRTELPINKDGDYFYANEPSVFYSYGLGRHILDLSTKETLIELGEEQGKKITFPVYKEEPDIYSDIKDAGLEFNSTYGNKYSLNYLYEKTIWDLSESIEEDIQFAKIDQEMTSPTQIQSFLYSQAYNKEFKDEGSGVLLIYKNRDDISAYNETLYEDESVESYDKVPVYENINNISNHLNSSNRAETYEVTADSLSNVFNSDIQDYIRGLEPNTLEISSLSKSVLDSSFNLTPSNISKGSQKLGYTSNSGGGGISAKSFTDPVSSFTSYFDRPTSTGRRITIPNRNSATADTATGNKDDSRPKPIGTSTGGTVGTSGKNADIGTSTTTGGAVTGDKVGEVSTSNSSSNTRAEAGATTNAPSKAEEDEEEDLPAVPVVTDILKPLIDWRNDMLSLLKVPPISGTCPALSFSFYDVNISVDAHCLVFNEISGLISAFMTAIWAIAAFRVLFSA